MTDEWATNELLNEIELLLGTLGKHHATSVYDRLKVIRRAVDNMKNPRHGGGGSIRELLTEI